MMSTRVPFAEEYVISLGKAVYFFSYYEWIVIYIIDYLQRGFIAEYSRGERPMTSGHVSN